MARKAPDLRKILSDAHAYFFILKGGEAMRLKLWNILPDSIVIETPTGAPMRKTILGYIPTLDGREIYEIEGKVNVTPLPDQMPNTIRVEIDPGDVRRVNRRAYPRYNFAPPLKASIITKGEDRAVPGRIINLSAGGLRVETAHRLSPEKKYAFRFEIEFDEEIHELAPTGAIVYEVPSEAGLSYGVKFEFTGTKPEEGEAPVESLDRTVDMMNLVNRLLVREEN